MHESAYNTSIDVISFSHVVPSNYGITIAASPVRFDFIDVNVGEVKSIDDRFYDSESSIINYNSQQEEMYNKLQDIVDKISSNTQDAQKQFSEAISSLQDGINQATDVLNRVNTKTSGMDFSQENGLVLYGSDDYGNEGFKLQLAAMAINFIYGAIGSQNPIASIVVDDITQRVLMNISNIVVGERMMINSFAFIPRTNGNMCIKYIGNNQN